jgi:hypothetical protein
MDEEELLNLRNHAENSEEEKEIMRQAGPNKKPKNKKSAKQNEPMQSELKKPHGKGPGGDGGAGPA